MRLGVKDLNEDTGAGGCCRFSHNMFDVLFDRLLGNEESVRDFFICPPFGQMLYHGLLTISELEFFPGMVCIEVLSPPQFLHGDDQTCMFDSSPIGKAKASKENRLVGISAYSLELKLFPVFCFSPNMERLDDFPAELCEGRRKDSMRRSRGISCLFRRIDFLRQLRCLTIHVEQLHCGRQYHYPRTGSLVSEAIRLIGMLHRVCHEIDRGLRIVERNGNARQSIKL